MAGGEGRARAGKTTALFYTGGTEQRGPQNVNGGHNLMARETVKAIALKLGNAIAMPVLPYTPNNASAALPGTIGLTPELLAAVLERISEQAIVTGFKNVILMGDHGGGQPGERSRTSTATSRRSSTTSTRRRASTSTSATTCTRSGWRTSTRISSRRTCRPAGTPAFRTRPRCCISAATRVGPEDLIKTAVGGGRGEPGNRIPGTAGPRRTPWQARVRHENRLRRSADPAVSGRPEASGLRHGIV